MSSLTAVTIRPARGVRGRLTVPGDKSISHRYALLSALAEGRTRIVNYAPGADCRSTVACLRRLGVDISIGDTNTETVTLLGRGFGQLCSTDRPLDAGNSGTTMRLLAGVLAGQPFTTTIAGDASLSRRPMGRVIGPLERMGARIDAVEGHAPLTIAGTPALRGLAHHPDVPSAQVKSAILLAGLHAGGTTTVTEPALTRDHTERALAAFGVPVAIAGLSVSVSRRPRLAAQDLSVPGDFSSAAFWLVAAAAFPGSLIEIEQVGLNPTRIALLDVLRRFGARVRVEITATLAGEPRGTVIVEGDRTGSIENAPDEVPGLIDELPAIAALAANGGTVEVRGARELRVKESDRIATLVAGFRALGLDADERPDGFVVQGRSTRTRAVSAGHADARGDHRMAMAFAVAALAGGGASTIHGADSVGISYPGFFETLAVLAQPDGV